VDPLTLILGLIYLLEPAIPLIAGSAAIAAEVARPRTAIEAPLGSESRPMPEAPSRPALSTVAPIDGGHVGPASAVDVPPAPNAHVPARIQ